jgi:hypothetical protein
LIPDDHVFPGTGRPWWRGEGAGRRGPLLRCSGMDWRGLSVLLISRFSPPAGRGGEGRRSGASGVCRSRAQAQQGGGMRISLCMLEATFSGVPKRPLQCIAAINGVWSHSLLGCAGSPSFFLQAGPLRRIFIDLDKGFTAGVVPSGMFPGDGGGTLADRSCRRGEEDQGLDCVSVVLPRVFLAKGLALSCIPLSLRGLVVILFPPLG